MVLLLYLRLSQNFECKLTRGQNLEKTNMFIASKFLKPAGQQAGTKSALNSSKFFCDFVPSWQERVICPVVRNIRKVFGKTKARQRHKIPLTIN